MTTVVATVKALHSKPYALACGPVQILVLPGCDDLVALYRTVSRNKPWLLP